MTIGTVAQREAVVGMGELMVGRAFGTLCCIGLGSCVAICAYDNLTHVGGMVHVVLPASHGNGQSCRAKYADTAVPLLLEEVIRAGASKNRLVIKLVGGARMSLAPGMNDAFKTGERNITGVLASLEKEGTPFTAQDTGGNKGRTVRMYLDSGKVTVKAIGESEKEL